MCTFRAPSNPSENPNRRLTVVLGILLQPVLPAALHAGGVGAAVAGHGAAGLQLAVGAGARESVLGPHLPGFGVGLDAGGVGAAVGGGGVPGQPLVPDAAGAAAAGARALLQLLHVQVQGVADVGFPVLLLLCRGARNQHDSRETRPPWKGTDPLAPRGVVTRAQRGGTAGDGSVPVALRDGGAGAPNLLCWAVPPTEEEEEEGEEEEEEMLRKRRKKKIENKEEQEEKKINEEEEVEMRRKKIR